MPLKLTDSVDALPGVGAVRAKALAKLGLETVGDLLGYFPRDYEDRRTACTLRQAEGRGAVCVTAMVAELPQLSRIRKGLELTKVRLVDDTGSATAVFFNQGYVRQALVPGQSYCFYGQVERSGSRLQMTNPVFEREGHTRFTGRLMPVYPLTAGVSNNLLAGLTLRCVEDCAGQLPEAMPEDVRAAYALAQSEFSYRNIHFPADEQALALARRRLIFEELFYFSCGLALLRRRRAGTRGPAFSQTDPAPFCALLPFSPTHAQRRAMEEAAADLAAEAPMNRLVQGDVGSGKTAVAAACAWLAFRSGWQCALMAPTELLAGQHLRTLTGMLAPAGVRLGLLTGSLPAGEKRRVRQALAAGELDLVVGTHALLSEGVDFCRLGLVITDEQHRFGVAQRAALAAKGGGLTPNVLVMSATPIPRTLALILYGDLEVSVIDELPPGRTPVKTYLVGEDKRQRLYGFVRRLVSEGRQAYIVCPAVEENPEAGDLKAVTAYAGDLEKTVFPDLRVAFVHGRLKAREKDAIMSAFVSGAIDVLVSTTVIEVGVDVPNASLMIVENAERFGLSQLHQLRGRVGRGSGQAYCVLMTASRSQESLERLRALKSTSDGFQIAEADLRLRGPGDFFGSRQHGLPQLRIADLAGDMEVLRQARQAAGALIAADPGLSRPEHRAVRARVQAMFTDNPDMFN